MKDTNERRKAIGQARRERTRRKLLEASARLIALGDAKKLTIDDFIQEAGVSRGTFYNYYSTKDELIDDLWSRMGHDPFLSISQTCIEITDPARRLITMARLVLDCARKSPAWGWLVYSLSEGDKSINADLLSYPRPDLIQGQQAGRFKFNSLLCASDLTVGTTRLALRNILTEGRSKEYVDEICQMILMALGFQEEEASIVIAAPSPQLEIPCIIELGPIDINQAIISQ